MKPYQQPVNKALEQTLKKEGSVFVKAYSTNDGLHILFTRDKTHHGLLYHISISREVNYPNWDEIVAVKEILLGNIDVMMIIPKRADYINFHKNCFHIWQTPQEWGIR